MSDRVSAEVAAALDRVVSDNGWLAASRPGSLRASLSDVLGSAADQHRAELDAVVVSAEEGVPSRLRTAGRAGAHNLAPELTQQLVDWGMTESLASSVVETWADLVPEISSSAPAAPEGPTVVSAPREAEVAPTPPVSPPPVTAPPVTTPPDRAAEDPVQGRTKRPSVWLAAAVAVVVVIATGAWLGLRHRASDDPPLVAMLNHAIGPAAGLVPTKACTATDTHVVCTQPTTAIRKLEMETFPDVQSLYDAYSRDAEQLRGAPLELNVGNCNSRERSGEVSWNHQYQHPKTYTIDDHMSGDLMKDGSAEGRLACSISGSFMTIVWSDDCGNLLGRIEGPVMSLFTTWKALHHNIVPPTCEPMDMGDQMPSPSATTSMGGM